MTFTLLAITLTLLVREVIYKSSNLGKEELPITPGNRELGIS